MIERIQGDGAPLVWPDGITPNTQDMVDSIARHARRAAQVFGNANNGTLARSRWLVGVWLGCVVPAHLRCDCFKRDGERWLVILHGVVDESQPWPAGVSVERLPLSWWRCGNAFAVREATDVATGAET
jgi:hypothetical protein